MGRTCHDDEPNTSNSLQISDSKYEKGILIGSFGDCNRTFFIFFSSSSIRHNDTTFKLINVFCNALRQVSLIGNCNMTFFIFFDTLDTGNTGITFVIICIGQ